MKLTYRQRAFLAGLLDLYREADVAISYTRVAERMRVTSATAYEMLRALERRGLVVSEYGEAPRRLGAGRAPVLFRPSAEADRLVAELVGGGPGDAEWETIRARILAALRRGDVARGEIVEEILRHVPEASSPLALSGELLTALLLTLGDARSRLGDRALLDGLPAEAKGRLGLAALAGAALGLSWAGPGDRAVLAQLKAHLGAYQEAVAGLSTQAAEELGAFIRDVRDLLARPREPGVANARDAAPDPLSLPEGVAEVEDRAWRAPQSEGETL